MIPAAVGYVRADSAEAAVAALSEHGDEAKLLAGGQSLIPLMKLRLARPSVLVDLGRADELRGISVDGDSVSIGALTSHSTLEHSADLAEACPLLAHVASQVGDPAVRHRGTLGGSLAHADPASDLPAAVLALGGTLVATGPGGSREIAATDFFTGFLESALAVDEVLTEVRVPVSTGGWCYQKFNRRAQDWAIVGVVVAEGGAGVGLVNMGQIPLRASAVEAALAGGASAVEAAAAAADGTEPPSDNNADVAYREHLVRVLTERALAAAGA
ncbi:MAG: xanthine dehydrogenase family protein subunit M [Acidimicrobiales bacterium]|nr:xanthine dehydrogenase family protein subunit M [Acidimicrobiales bacterium]RUA26979.1 MAG: xanthine dehydrogenase family protein subunit M [Actinomycetota bacterium]HBL09283.1 carbon monoxide dehydrogenase [Acidimicrobiaceae bacterium]